jgi:hypothetical protein
LPSLFSSWPHSVRWLVAGRTIWSRSMPIRLSVYALFARVGCPLATHPRNTKSRGAALERQPLQHAAGGQVVA